MKVFRSLGLDQKLLELGNPFNYLNITKANLDMLSSVNTAALFSTDVIQNIAIHRATLHQFLMEEAGVEHIHVGKRLKTITEENNGYLLTFEDGTKAEAEYVIGADGLRSKVRNLMFQENELRDAHQLCWRGDTNLNCPTIYTTNVMKPGEKVKDLVTLKSVQRRCIGIW